MTYQHPDRLEGYERFFGFREVPFGVAPNPRFLFETPSHAAALEQVAYALNRRESLVVVTGEIGTGKTLLCRTVVQRLERKTFVSVVSDPLLESDELLKLMLQDFGVISRDRMHVPATRHDLMKALEEFLVSLAPIGAHAVLIIDEAQHVRPEVMEQIRLLSNVHDDHGTMLEIILVGQPDLEAMLARPDLRQVQQRVSRRLHLESLTGEQVAAYIGHRVAVARGYPTADAVFTPEAVSAVWQASAGIPRVVNILCDRALEAAFARQERTVDASLIATAARVLDLQDALPPAEQPAAPELAAEFVPFAAAHSLAATEPRGRWGFMLAASLALVAMAIGSASGLIQWSRAIDRVVSEESPARAGLQSYEPGGNGAAPAPAGTSMTAGPTPILAAAPAEPLSESFEIVVASFRTETRARAVAMSLATLDQPVRQRVADGWQQVLTGPFASRALADEAQQELGRAGFAGTHIVRAVR